MSTIETILKDFGAASRSKKEQDPSAKAEGIGGVGVDNGRQDSEGGEFKRFEEIPRRGGELDVLLQGSPEATEEAAQGIGRLSDRKPEMIIGEDVPDLHGFKDANMKVQQEKEYHRIIALLKASGYSNVEIALHVGCTPPTVAYIVKTPWCKQFIMDEIHRRGGAQVQEFMASHALSAAEVLVAGFSEDKMEARRDKVAAAEKLLDRVFGRPTQTVVNHKGTDLTKLSDDELASIATTGGAGVA